MQEVAFQTANICHAPTVRLHTKLINCRFSVEPKLHATLLLCMQSSIWYCIVYFCTWSKLPISLNTPFSPTSSFRSVSNSTTDFQYPWSHIAAVQTVQSMQKSIWRQQGRGATRCLSVWAREIRQARYHREKHRSSQEYYRRGFSERPNCHEPGLGYAH